MFENMCCLNELSASTGSLQDGQCVQRVERINWFPTKCVPNELSESTGYISVQYDTCANELSASTGLKIFVKVCAPVGYLKVPTLGLSRCKETVNDPVVAHLKSM